MTSGSVRSERAGHKWITVPPVVTLARWRMRRTWSMLLMTGIGILVAVILSCAIPLYTQLTMTAGLNRIWNASAGNADITVHSYSKVISTALVQSEEQQLDDMTRHYIGPYLAAPFQFSLQTASLSILKSSSAAQMGDPAALSGNVMQLISYPLQQATNHISLLQGRLPQTNNDYVEVALTASTAQSLHVGIGSQLTLGLYFTSQTSSDNSNPSQTIGVPLSVRVVGIFSDNKPDAFWHNVSFKSTQPGYFSALTDNEALLHTLSHVASQYRLTGLALPNPTDTYWYYELNTGQITSTNMDTFTSALANLQFHVVRDFTNTAQLQGSVVSGATVPSATEDTPTILEQYESLTGVVQIPVALLTAQALALILFFVTMMADMLVERQAGAVAVLRSRGASRGQIFGSFLVQGVGVCLMALVLGPLLALALVYEIGRRTFSATDQAALAMVQQQPLQVLWTLRWFVLGTVGIALLALIIALIRVVNMNVLSMRREATRATRRPLWQRAYLDVMAAVIALTGYILSVNIANTDLANAQVNVLIVSPLALVAPLFLLLAGILLSLRGFPFILRVGASLAMRRRGPAPMLALAQMARAPRRVVSMILLLALATAFALFTLVFSASQTQHMQDMSTYQAAADFSGQLAIQQVTRSVRPGTKVLEPSTSDLYNEYNHIPGVRSVSLGYRDDGFSVASIPNPVSLLAVDTQTFARTATWSPQDSTQSLSSLMAQLDNASASPLSSRAIPAIVDTSLWNALNLHRGSVFVLTAGMITKSFFAVGEVQHIPPIDDSTETESIGNYSPPAGLLVSFNDYQLAYARANPNAAFLSMNCIWLSTRDDAASLASVRAALSRGSLRLTTFSDRRALLNELVTDPPYLALISTLMLGAVAALLLALLGNIVTSWISVHGRLTNFALLRALGTTPRQIVSMLIWEQGMVYITALILGVIFGALLIRTVLPTLVFTGVQDDGVGMSNGAIYTVQHLLPIQITLPPSVSIPLGVLFVLCISAIVIMVLVIARLSTSQVLRLNED